MDVTYTTKVIILSRQPFREFDSKVAVYSADKGKLELVARGAKKISSKLAGHLEPVSFSNIMVVRGKRFDYIGGAVSERCFSGIKSDIDKLLAAERAVAVSHQIIKESEPDRQVFDLLLNFLISLNNRQAPSTDYDLFYYFFVLKLLVALGYGPELYNCAVCKKKIVPRGNRLDLSKGGVVCGGCGLTDKQTGAIADKNTATKVKTPTAHSWILDIPRSQDSGMTQGGGLIISENCIKVLRTAVKDNWDKIIRVNIDNKLKKEVIQAISSFCRYYF